MPSTQESEIDFGAFIHTSTPFYATAEGGVLPTQISPSKTQPAPIFSEPPGTLTLSPPPLFFGSSNVLPTSPVLSPDPVIETTNLEIVESDLQLPVLSAEEVAAERARNSEDVEEIPDSDAPSEWSSPVKRHSVDLNELLDGAVNGDQKPSSFGQVIGRLHGHGSEREDMEEILAVEDAIIPAVERDGHNGQSGEDLANEVLDPVVRRHSLLDLINNGEEDRQGKKDLSTQITLEETGESVMARAKTVAISTGGNHSSLHLEQKESTTAFQRPPMDALSAVNVITENCAVSKGIETHTLPKDSPDRGGKPKEAIEEEGVTAKALFKKVRKAEPVENANASPFSVLSSLAQTSVNVNRVIMDEESASSMMEFPGKSKENKQLDLLVPNASAENFKGKDDGNAEYALTIAGAIPDGLPTEIEDLQAGPVTSGEDEVAHAIEAPAQDPSVPDNSEDIVMEDVIPQEIELAVNEKFEVAELLAADTSGTTSRRTSSRRSNAPPATAPKKILKAPAKDKSQLEDRSDTETLKQTGESSKFESKVVEANDSSPIASRRQKTQMIPSPRSAPGASLKRQIEAEHNPEQIPTSHTPQNSARQIDEEPKQTPNDGRRPSLPVPASPTSQSPGPQKLATSQRQLLTTTGGSQNKDILMAELKAMKIASIQARTASLEAEIAVKRAKLEEVTKQLTRPAAETVKRHIKLLHDYNDIRDVGQGLIGMIADNRGVRIGELYEEFGVGLKD